MKRSLTSIIIVLLIASCHTAKTAFKTNPPDRDGSSFEKAIVIQEKSEMTGVSAEYSWLDKHYQGYQSEGQSLVVHKKIPYDILKVKSPDGTEREVYFDISNYYGKF